MVLPRHQHSESFGKSPALFPPRNSAEKWALRREAPLWSQRQGAITRERGYKQKLKNRVRNEVCDTDHRHFGLPVMKAGPFPIEVSHFHERKTRKCVLLELILYYFSHNSHSLGKHTNNHCCLPDNNNL